MIFINTRRKNNAIVITANEMILTAIVIPMITRITMQIIEVITLRISTAHR